MAKGGAGMKNTLKLSNYLFHWYFRKSGRYILSFSLGIASLLLLISSSLSPNNTFQHIAKEFRTFDMVIDYSGTGIVFFLGLVTLFITLFIQMNGFYTNGKGMYSILTLPMKRCQVFYAFFLSASAVVFLYFALWLVAMVALYIPITSMYVKAAFQSVLRISQSVTVRDIDTSISNGFFLAFHRSIFLSSCFPVSWIQVLSLSGGMFLSITAIVFAGLYNESVFTRVLLFVVVLAGFFVAFYRAWIFFDNQLFYSVRTIMPQSLYLFVLAGLLGVVLMIVAINKLKRRKDI